MGKVRDDHVKEIFSKGDGRRQILPDFLFSVEDFLALLFLIFDCSRMEFYSVFKHKRMVLSRKKRPSRSNILMILFQYLKTLIRCVHVCSIC